MFILITTYLFLKKKKKKKIFGLHSGVFRRRGTVSYITNKTLEKKRKILCLTPDIVTKVFVEINSNNTI